MEAPQTPLVFPRVLRNLWAVAACLMLVLGTWWLLDPSPQLTNGFHLLGGGDTSNYWDQASRQSDEWRAIRNFIRDISLLVATATTFVLAIPVAWWAIRGLRKRRIERTGSDVKP